MDERPQWVSSHTTDICHLAFRGQATLVPGITRLAGVAGPDRLLPVEVLRLHTFYKVTMNIELQCILNHSSWGEYRARLLCASGHDIFVNQSIRNIFYMCLYLKIPLSILGFPGDSDSKESACRCRSPGFNPWVRKIPWRRKWLSTSVFLPKQFHGQKF